MADYKDITDWKDYNYLLDKIIDWEDKDYSLCLSMRLRCKDTYNTVYSYRTQYGESKYIGVSNSDLEDYKREGLYYGIFASIDKDYDYSFPDKFYSTVSHRFDRIPDYAPAYMLILKRKD